MNAQTVAVRNRLLACVSPADFDALRPHLRRVALRRREILLERNRAVEQVFFIEEGVASIFARTQQDGPVEVGIVGRLGFVGIPLVLGTLRSPNRCLMQTPGVALAIGARELQRTIDDNRAIRQLVLGYAHALLIQHSQTALCNVRHSLDARLCRWLLLASERLDGERIPLTHDSISVILGVRRAGVTAALSKLEMQGAIRKARATVEIIGRGILDRKACECYRIISRQYRCFTDNACHVHSL